MSVLWHFNITFLEEGNIYFFYKPKKGRDEVRGLIDISRFYLVLDPYGGKGLRFLILGPKKMPGIDDGQDRAWGYIEKVGGRGFMTGPKPKYRFTGQARPAGEGVYAIVRHAQHTHLVYSLELPHRLGEVQKTLNINREGSYICVIKHPDAALPQDPRGREFIKRQYARYNVSLTDKFQNRRYIPLDPPSFLDHEGTMVYLIGVSDNVGRLGLTVNKNRETEETADIFRQLQLNKSLHPIKPLLKGNWQ